MINGKVNMSTLELREMLLEKISVMEDEGLLQEIASLIETDHQLEDDYEMSDDEIAAINEGIAQLDNGQWITNEESNKRADEWLKKLGGL